MATKATNTVTNAWAKSEKDAHWTKAGKKTNIGLVADDPKLLGKKCPYS